MQTDQQTTPQEKNCVEDGSGKEREKSALRERSPTQEKAVVLTKKSEKGEKDIKEEQV